MQCSNIRPNCSPRGYGTNQQSKGKWKSQMTKVTSKMINGLTLVAKFCYVPIPAWSFFGREVILGAPNCDTLCSVHIFWHTPNYYGKGNNGDNRGNLDQEILKKGKKTAKKVIWKALITFLPSLPQIISITLALFFFKITLHFSCPSYAPPPLFHVFVYICTNTHTKVLVPT